MTGWNQKRVLITGINGFIGGNLAKRLLQNGAKVTGIERNLNRQSLLYFEGLNEQASIVNGDLCDMAFIERVLAEGEFEFVFHLAAQVEVGVALTSPYTTFETNIRGTYTLLDAIRKMSKPIKAVVLASTDKAYGSYPSEAMPYQEDYPLRPVFPYDTSKACADLIAQSYAGGTFKLPIVVTRFCNIYGPGQLNFSALIPDAIMSGLGYKKFIPRGNGKHIRDFIYAADVADLYMRIAESLAEAPERFRGKIYNAGTNSPRSVLEVLEELFTLLGKSNDLEQIVELMEKATTAGEIDTQYMDYKTVKRDFGWEPTTSFASGLTETIEWYRKYLNSELGAPV